MSALAELARRLREEGGLLAGAAADPAPDAPADLGTVASAGEATRTRAPAYALLVEAVREAHLAHYGHPRVLATEDPDLALLAGDHLYALGLAELAELEDLASVEILAGVIAECAQAHAEGRPDDAEAAWRAGARAIAALGGPQSEAGPNT
jgi:hypothetical protein